MSPRTRAIQVSNDTKNRMASIGRQFNLSEASELIVPPRLDSYPYYVHTSGTTPFGVIEGDPIDISLDWEATNHKNAQKRLSSTFMTGNSSSGYAAQASSPVRGGQPSSPMKGVQASNQATGIYASPFSPPLSPTRPSSQQQHHGQRCTSDRDYNDRLKNSNILLLNPCSETTPGGDWLSGSLGPEESLARRSNLVQSLCTPVQGQGCHYPIPSNAGIYSSNIVIFREGHTEDYSLLTHEACGHLSVVSVSPVKRPRLDDRKPEGYAFDAERDDQTERMRIILRIAYLKGHEYLCLGAFGATVHNASSPKSPTSPSSPSSGSSVVSDPVYGGAGRFRNPLEETIRLWKQVLAEEEFSGRFIGIIFAVQQGTGAVWERILKSPDPVE